MKATPLADLTDADFAAAGGKARGLALLIRHGFAVPRGWSVAGGDRDFAPVLAAWRAAGSPPVAVRSSAAAEDSSARSFAGQFRTVLDVRTEESLAAALAEVLDSQRRETAYGAAAGAAAAVVQEMVEPEFAGVAFGRDPVSGRGVLIESVKGRGDALVSGEVTPARLRIADGKSDGERQLPDALARDVAAGAADVERKFGAPQDVEWASAAGRLWFLQARPIVPTAGILLADLRARAPRPTCWSARYNLAETVPAPTPMTWAFLRRMMSWEGGYGRAFRRFGFFFRDDVRASGFVELVGGRVYADLEREAGTYFGAWPLAYDFDAMRQNPALASRPEPKPDWRRTTPGFWLRFPWYAWRLLRAQSRLNSALRTFPAEFGAWETALRERTRAAPRADVPELLRRFDRAAAETAEMALAASLLASYEYERTPAAKRKDLRAWLPSELAHRGPGEMELASPRWREMPAELERLASSAPPGRDAAGVYALRERGKDALLRDLDILRRDLLEIGLRTGLGEDVFYLEPGELARPDAARAAARRRERDALLRIPLPPLIFSDGAEAAGAGNASAALSPGRATGVASLPTAIAGYEPPPEAVLVLPSLDPAWTLLFTRVRAVVVERGGVLSHGAIVARELGVPCVCRPGARAEFREGQRIAVDGDLGTVEPTKRQDSGVRA
ncbi:MAG: hypothetical protein HYY18_11440 [Planctomycetes bacterium]|nr:hypothetical protein [Planctomycetota bacterium]